MQRKNQVNYAGTKMSPKKAGSQMSSVDDADEMTPDFRSKV